MKLKSKFNARLFHDFVRREAGFYLSVNGKISIGNGAVPNVVVALPMSDKNAAFFGKDFSHLFFIFCHLHRQGFGSLGAKDDRNGFCATDVVQLKQFGNGESHPFHQGIERAAFHDKSGNVIACGDPNRRLVVPCHFYKIVHNQSPVRNATNSITKNLKKSNGGI